MAGPCCDRGYAVGIFEIRVSLPRLLPFLRARNELHKLSYEISDWKSSLNFDEGFGPDNEFGCARVGAPNDTAIVEDANDCALGGAAKGFNTVARFEVGGLAKGFDNGNHGVA